MNQLPSHTEVVEAMKAEITELITAGTVPAGVANFSELHDYIDANMLAEDLFPAFPDSDNDEIVEAHMNSITEILNPAQTAVSEWLGAGRNV